MKMKSSKLVQKDSFQQSGNEEILLSAHLRKEHPKENSYNQGKDAENSFLLNNKKLKRKYNLIIALLLSFILFQYLWYIICLLRQLYNDTHQESRSLYSNSSVDLTFKSGYIVLYDDFYLKNNSQAEEKYEAEIKKAIESASLSNSNCTTKTERIRYFKRKNGILSALVAIDVHLNINSMEQNFSNFLEKFQTVLLKSNPAWNLIDIKFENFSNPILSKFNNSVIMSHMTSLLSKEKLTNDDSQEQSFETFNYIHSNGFPGRYLPNTDHSWEIINPDEQDGQVQLKILALNLAYDQHTKSCSDYIEIYIHNTLHSRLCQIPTNPMQRTIISMFNDVKIRFVSKDHQDYENFGFLIEWQFNQVPCVPNPCANGGVCSRDKFGFVSCVCPSGYNGTFCDVATNCNTPVLTDIEGSIVTPNLYLGYQSGSSCNWLIRAPFNHIIHVTTLSFFLNDPKICSDYIRINDYSPFADDLGTHSKRFCGSDISSKFISKYDTIEIQFAAESNDQFPGAAFKYKIAPNYCLLNPCNSFQDCFNTADGYICQCKPGRVGEDCSRSKFYSLNYLKCAYKVDFCFSHPCKKPGTDECINLNETFFCKCSAGYSGSLCELSACDFHPTCKNNGICLVNDAGLAACKCKANFTGYDCSSVRCNDIFDEETGSLSSPSFPVDGSSTFQCQYRFIAKDRKGFLFNFKNVKLRSTYFDNVYIFSSWNTIDNDMIYSFNGIPDDFEISVRASKALILLSGSADPMENNYGFELQYSSTFACDDLHSGCASKETCISFNESIAHVSGEDNTNADYKKENDFCNPNPCKNNGKCISLANDFKCQCPPYYFAGKRCEIINCQNIRLDSKFGFIVPPGYPNEYVPNLNCSWIFTLNETTMEYTFQSLMFNVEGPQNRCSNDYLEFDSAEDHSRKMRACGVLESAALQLEYPNPLIVRFVTDEDVEEDGFFINYRHQMKGKCNETLKSKYGDIFLPDKSILEQFQGNVCTWTFESSIGGFVDLYIERFKSNDCQKNYLQILDVDINGKNEIICETSYKRIKSPQNKFVINVFMENKSGVTFKANYRIKDNCDMLSCPENSKCTRLNDRLFCHCNEGYTYVRGRCNPLRCAASPCLNGGTCIENLRKNIHCKCSQYYGGQFCQIDLLCNDHTCSFGNGVCIHVDGKPHCACKPEFTGESCQFKILGNILPHFQILNSRTDLQYSHGCVNESIEIFTLWGKLLYRICLIQPKRQLYINYSSIRISVKMKAASNSVVLARIFTVDNLSTRAAVVCSNQSYCFNKELDLCSEMQCNGGHCVSTNNTYAACKCPAGYAGSYCEEKIKTCEAMPCKNGGSCLPRRNGYLCKCTKQFYGVNCEKRMCSHLIVDTPSGVIKSPHFPSNYPDNSECSWKIVTNPDSLIWLRFFLLDIEGIPGQCHFDVVKIYNGENSASELLSSDCGYKTETTPPIKLDIVKNIVTVNFVTDSSVNSRGFMLLWNITSSLCRNVKCPLHSVCELGVNGTPICTCDFGYYGEKCEEVDHCLYVTCANGGTCKTHGNSFHCICSSGITGLLCDEDIDECIENPCKNKGICVNNYAWIIAPEKYNRYAQLNPLLVDLINGEKIQIFDGNYWNISHDVQLIAEFDKDVEALFPVRAYQNWLSVFFWTTGTFLPEKKLIFDAFLTSSESPPGCQDRDCKYPILTSFEICKVKRLGLPWLKLFHWELRRDSECATTIFFGQKKLVNITFNANRCLNHSCPPHSSCVSYPESYHCRCDKGYAGFDCQEAIDQCSSSPCVLGHGMCANKPDGSFVCRCKEGYTGKHCEHDLICPLNYCQHKGRCERESGKPRCICKGPFSGPRCEQASCGETTVSYFYIFESMNHPEPYPPSLDCKWTITTKNVGSYVDLECGWDYVKIQLSNDEIITLCQAKKKTVYSDNSTLNMWFHSDSSKSGKGFYITAEAIINPCVKQPCGNNFICQVTGPNSRECICEPGYTGKECDEIIDICADVDCKNGGSCYADKLNFTCVCRKGYRGKFCEIQSNPCIPNPCGHFGICKQVDIAKHTCSCILPASGNSCRIEYKIIISHSGVIKSPEYPFSYPNEMQCDWLLYSILDAGSDFDFCSKFPCKNDGICENSIVLKEARSRSCQCRSKAYHGFSCETRRYFKCGQLLESKPSLSGIVATPDFPLPYNSSYCKWPIQVPKDHIIEITFTTLETYRNCSKCCTGADQVLLEDQNGHIISKFCGHALPPIFTVQSDHVVVVFNAKQTSNTGIGFHLLYRAVQNVCFNDKYCLTNQSCVIDRYGKPFCICPFGYEGRYCTEREFVKIMQRLGDVDVEKDIQGVYMTGATNLNVKMGEHVYIPKVDLYAFALMKQLDTKCGGIIRRPLIGTITSPKNFSTNYYFKGTDCEWEFIAPEGTCVHLKFYWIDLSCTSYYAAFGMCTPENIKIYNSKNKSLVPLKRLCFEPTTLEVVSLKNNLILSYHSEKDDDFEHYDKDNCFEGACAEQFLCVDQLDDKYKCICKPGFTGKNCDIVFDACASLPSGFCGEGRCVNVGDSFYCECSPGWTGEVCMDEINYCDSSPCIYGTCHSLKNAYYCSCIETYEYYSYGPQCEFVACKSITLSNDHGILQSPFYPEPSPKVADLNAAYCATDYLAIFDQAEISEINEDQPQELICDRLTTKRIEVHSDEFSLLFASGKLNDTISKFYGRYMTVDPSLCTPNPCQNNGNCSIEADGTIICKCPINYYGQLCEKKATVICDAETKEINGTFSVSPDPLYTTCSWTIYNTPVGNKAATEIEIHELYIPNDDCNENFLEIYTKKDYFTEFVLLRKLCSVSNELSSKIMSVDGYAVKLILRSIDVERKFAFSYNFDVCTAKNIICKDTKYCVNTHYGTASYSCLCKPKLTDPTCFSPCQNLKLPGSVGAFNSPGFPHLYPSNVHCSWRIKNRSNSTAIMLTMKYMNIRDNSPYCDDEYIEIHSVSRNHSNLMQKICGKMLDVKFFTMAEEMIIYFHTDVYFGGNGFVATYGIVNNPCIYLMCKNGGFCYIHKPSLQPDILDYCVKSFETVQMAIVSTEVFAYQNTKNRTVAVALKDFKESDVKSCNYFLETESSAISVQFEKLFFGWQTECKDSYVEIHEGWDQTNSSIIGRYCNNEEMPALIGTQSNNRLFLVVRAIITSDKAANYTFKVREDFKCHYTICPNSDCSQRQNEILCICPPYMTGQLCDIERCGYSVVNESQGIIKSFGMPTQTYHFEQFGELSTFDPVFAPFRRFFRRYTITVPGFSGILLQILYFNVIDCTKNHVDIYVKEKFVERLCDVPITDEEVSIASDSVTKMSITRGMQKFKRWRSLCLSSWCCWDELSAIITSPRYPDLYMNNLSCLWKIAPNQKGKVVKAILTIDHIEGTMPECNQDFVAVSYLNSRQQEIEIGKYCGKNYTIQLTSATNNLIVKFKSDERITFSGFVLEYTLVRRGCQSFICLNGGTCSDSIFQIFCTCPPGYIGMFCEIDVFCAKHLCQHGATCLMGKCKCAEGFTGQFCENFVNSEQNIFQFPTTIVSPFYPHKYPNDINITWNLISVESGLLLRFKHISLEYSTSCDQNDFVQVSDLNRTIGIFCGSMLPPAIYTTNKYLKIIFHSDSSISMEGFEAFVANSKDPCEMFDCSGHGDCIAENGYVSCKCHKNYSGENCEINNACRDVLCMNSGTCILRKGASICNCRWPFTGATCADVLCGHYFKHIFNGKISFLSLVNSNVSNVDCTWTVEEPENSTISIHINNFQMKYPNEDCNSNFLEIVDRKSTKSTVIAKYCDSKNVTSLLATKTNLLTVRFVSKHAMDDSFAIDFTTDYQGKNICNFYCQNYGKCKIQNQKPICDCPDDLWCSSNPCLNGGTCKHNENNTTYQCICLKNFNVICGGTLKLWKRFTSPLYPNSYPNLSRCIWTYNDTKRNILLSFTNFQLELTDDCSNDYVAIERCSVVSGCSSILKSRYCGDKRFKILIQLHAFQRNWEWLKITFISDSTDSFRGFSAKLLPSDMKILNSSVAE
ncbi:Neurogenic locus Notch protein [Trichinella pseudospiralis]|uniref:Neurogenic locus Notch protein n=1 Tax=Trichinella pseudospiralis TaxID=6337 RepID=A0A0V1IMU6_TRIPS|nr:Neurogenic locus Notch protein [Trichinella pseudospiralis]